MNFKIIVLLDNRTHETIQYIAPRASRDIPHTRVANNVHGKLVLYHSMSTSLLKAEDNWL